MAPDATETITRMARKGQTCKVPRDATHVRVVGKCDDGRYKLAFDVPMGCHEFICNPDRKRPIDEQRIIDDTTS